MLTKTLSEAKKKQRSILIKAMNNDIGSIDSAKDSWNPAQISERAKGISYIRSLVDSWNPAQLNEALKMLDLPVIDTWNPAQIEEQRRNLVFYLAERTLTGNPITLKILGNLTPEVTGLKVTMNPIQSGTGDPSPTNIRPISGRTEASVTRMGKNVFNLAKYLTDNNITYTKDGDWFIFSIGSALYGNKFTLPELSYYSGQLIIDSARTVATNVNLRAYKNGTAVTQGSTFTNQQIDQVGFNYSTTGQVCCKVQVEYGATITDYHAYQGETHTHQYSETIYGGVDDFVNGGLTNEWGYIASYDGETIPGVWISDRDVYAPDTTPSTGAEIVYRLETPTTIETTPEEITLLKGTNVLSTDGDSIELKYKQNF